MAAIDAHDGFIGRPFRAAGVGHHIEHAIAAHGQGNQARLADFATDVGGVGILGDDGQQHLRLHGAGAQCGFDAAARLVGLQAADANAAGKGDRDVAVTADGDGLKLDDPLPERVKAAVPVVLERTGFPAGDVTVTSVPDVSFRMSDGEKVWTVTFNPTTGAVAGKTSDDTVEPLSARRFLTRLHLAHGYGSEVNARWAWALHQSQRGNG